MHMPEFAITTSKRHESDLVTRGATAGPAQPASAGGYKKIPERRRVASVAAEGARWGIRGMARCGLSGGCPFGPNRGSCGCEASVFHGGPNGRLQECSSDTEGSRGHAQEQSLVPRSLAPVDRTYRHRGSSATPASLYRERTIPAEHSGSPQEGTCDRPPLARSGHSPQC